MDVEREEEIRELEGGVLRAASTLGLCLKVKAVEDREEEY